MWVIITLCQYCVTKTSNKLLKMIHLSYDNLFKPLAPSKQNPNNVYTLGYLTTEHSLITNEATFDSIVA